MIVVSTGDLDMACGLLLGMALGWLVMLLQKMLIYSAHVRYQLRIWWRRRY
jgi:hypothetical protein